MTNEDDAFSVTRKDSKAISNTLNFQLGYLENLKCARTKRSDDFGAIFHATVKWNGLDLKRSTNAFQTIWEW